jgi:DNA-binding NtrC family response regulator
VVLMTAYADLDTAIDALRAGAADFLLKPFSLAQVLNAIQRCFERSRLARENFVLRREISTHAADIDGMVGQSELMIKVCERLKRIAPTPATVLLCGESGTGKEVAARALHRMSKRAHGPRAGQCAAISAELIESELFGHIKGAYTGAQQNREGLFYYARGGTLFLDEISELPLAAQAKLLRVLEERRIRPVGSEQEIAVDVRVIAATNRDLKTEVAAQRFRQDLYYRLQVLEVTLPPLRDRPEDIPCWSAISSASWRPASACRHSASTAHAGPDGRLRLAGQRPRVAQPGRAFADPRLVRHRPRAGGQAGAGASRSRRNPGGGREAPHPRRAGGC